MNNRKPDTVINNLKSKVEELFPESGTELIPTVVEGILLMHRFLTQTENYFKMEGTSKGRFLILARLLVSESEQGESISDLLPFYPISPATISGILDTLEKDDMIVRIPNPSDRRRINIKIKDKGKQFMLDFFPKHLKNMKTIIGHLTPLEKETLPVIFRKLNAGIEKVIESGGSKAFSLSQTENKDI